MTEEEAKTKWCPFGAGAPNVVVMGPDGPGRGGPLRSCGEFHIAHD